jgi:hypothetical protein
VCCHLDLSKNRILVILACQSVQNLLRLIENHTIPLSLLDWWEYENSGDVANWGNCMSGDWLDDWRDTVLYECGGGRKASENAREASGRWGEERGMMGV